MTDASKSLERMFGGVYDFLRRHRAAVAVFCVAVAARLLYAWVALPFIADAMEFSKSPASDGYCHIAECLLAGQGYRFHPDFGETMFRLPGYPLFLAGIWWLFGMRLWVVQLIQSLIAGCTCLLTYHIGKRYFCQLVGVLAGLAFALWPLDWVVCARYMTEPLYVFLVVLSLVMVLRLAASPGLGLAAVLGLMLGAASLVRQVHVLFAVALLITVPLLPLARGRRLGAFAKLALSTLVAAAVMAPWVLRGWRLTGSVIFPSTGGGFNLYSTVCFSGLDGYTGDLRGVVRTQLAPQMARTLARHDIRENSRDYSSSYWLTFNSIEDEVRADHVLRRVAMAEIRADPWRFLRTVLGNVAGFWFRGLAVKMTWVSRLLFVPLLVLVGIGLLTSIRSKQNVTWLLLLGIVYFNLVCAGTITFVRYTLPAMPAVSLLGARGLIAVLPARIRRGAANAEAGQAQTRLALGQGGTAQDVVT